MLHQVSHSFFLKKRLPIKKNERNTPCRKLEPNRSIARSLPKNILRKRRRRKAQTLAINNESERTKSPHSKKVACSGSTAKSTIPKARSKRIELIAIPQSVSVHRISDTKRKTRNGKTSPLPPLHYSSKKGKSKNK